MIYLCEYAYLVKLMVDILSNNICFLQHFNNFKTLYNFVFNLFLNTSFLNFSQNKTLKLQPISFIFFSELILIFDNLANLWLFDIKDSNLLITF